MTITSDYDRDGSGKDQTPSPPSSYLPTALLATPIVAVLFVGISGLRPIALSLVGVGIGFFLAFWGHRLGWLDVHRIAVVGAVFSFVVFVLSALGPINQGEFFDRPVCGNNLKLIGLSLLEYELQNKSLPPVCTTDQDGHVLHSWRTLILPEIEQLTVYSRCRLKEPWNSPHNRFLGQINIELFHCPKDSGFKDGNTSYVAVVGPGTAWRVGRGVALQAIKDGRYDTILLVEMKSSGIHWAEPKDLDLENLPLGITTDNLVRSLSPHERGFFALFADGHFEFIPNTISWDDFHAMLTIAGGEKVNRNW